MTEEREIEWDEAVPEDRPPPDDPTPEVPDQPLGPPAELEEDDAPLPGVPEREPPASE